MGKVKAKHMADTMDDMGGCADCLEVKKEFGDWLTCEKHEPTEYDPERMLPAYPPEDYSGSQADWMVGLQARGLWDGDGWHGDVMIRAEDWWALLEECEGE